MAFERYPSYGVHLNCKAPQVLSETHIIIEDCSDVQYHYTTPMAPYKVFLPPPDQYFNATKDEYRGIGYYAPPAPPQATKTTMTSHASVKPPLPRTSQGYYAPQVVKTEYHHEFPSNNHTKRYGKTEDHRSPAERPVINSSEAAKIYGGYVITEYSN